MDDLLFGPAGVPLSTRSRNTADGIAEVKRLGLGAMELEFVHGVKMGLETASSVRRIAEKTNVKLTAHAPYFINLNSQEKDKTEASIKRILDTARIAHACGGYSITFHAAYYMGVDKAKVFNIVKSHLGSIIKTLKSEGINIWVRPETTGKGSQFGDIDEIIKLGQELEMVMPCIDFSHLHARSGGKYNTYDEFSSVLERVEKGLGKQALSNIHAHLSGIAYSEKGERNHLTLKDSDMNYKDLMKAFRDFHCKGIVISESPNLEEDAIRIKEEYERNR